MTDTLINGEQRSSISINDRGLQYGDGLFETMVVRNSEIVLWPEHWQRLKLGCKKLSISVPDQATLEKEIKLLCSKNNETQFVMKLIITRGEGQRGYRVTENQKITRILSTYTWPEYPSQYQTQGVAVRYCETTISENSQLAGVKHLNRLEQILARNEWATDDFQEGLMLNINGDVIDGTMSNVFMVKNNKIITPDVSLSGVAGVMRNKVIELAKHINVSVCVEKIDKLKIKTADELFLTNSLFGIWPVKSLENITFSQVGKITKQLQEEVNILGY